ncbi:TPA: hypothetical protein ACH3X1_013228 [Trebouxia sp. C0004]
MLDTRHCRATIIKIEACTPAIAAESVRHFVQQVTSFTLRSAQVLSTVDSVRLPASAQEVEIAPDVHRNLKLAIAALEDLEGHRTSATAASARVQPKAASHKPGVTPAQTPRATPATARLPAQGTAANTSTQTKSTKSDQPGKKTKKRKVVT